MSDAADTVDTVDTADTVDAVDAEETADRELADNAALAEAEVGTGTRAQDPPVLVAATVGEVTAVWQVEVDARVVLGDFSGAWIIDADGIRGFAADADWIDRRHSRTGMLELLLARPVIVVGDGGAPVPVDTARASFGLEHGAAADLHIVDVPATVVRAAAAVEENRAAFAEANPGKRQPSWGGAWADGDFTPQTGRAPQNLTGDAEVAVIRAMAGARGLRDLVGSWNTLDKLRVQRLGEDHGGPLRALPLVMH